MKEIKFRAVVIDDDGKERLEYNVWPTGPSPGMRHLRGLVDNGGFWMDCIRFEQFTGLKDKNGKEIYEGDIVKWDDGSDGKYWRVAVVYWDENECIHCFRCVKNTLHELSTTDGYVFGANFMNRAKREAAKELIKVGNIYENAELLK